MKLSLKVAALSTLCSLLVSCGPTAVLAPLTPPADRMDCVAAGARPAIPAEYVIDWSKVTTVPQARTEHESFVRSVRNREGVVVGHLVDVEGKLFACSTDAEWLRDFYERLPDPTNPPALR